MFQTRSRKLLGMTFALVVAAAASSPRALRAQENAGQAFRQDLQKLVESASNELAERIAATVRDPQAHERFIGAVATAVGKRIDDLEKALAAKDREIAELRKKIEDLDAQVARAREAAQPTEPAAAQPAAEKKPTSAFLGVAHTDNDRGALVTDVLEGGPAAAAGIRKEDIILAVGDGRVTSPELSSILTTHAPGAEVRLKVLRGDRELDVPVKLADREKFFAARDAAARESASEPRPLVLGLEVEEPPDGGIVVEKVDAGFTGDAIGLAVGDRILSFGGKELKTLEDIQAAIGGVKAGDEFTLVTQRGDEKVRVVAVGSSGKGGARLVSRTPVEEKKDAQPAAEPVAQKERPGKPGHMGVTVYHDTVEDIVVIAVVEPGGPAERGGLKPGDILVTIAGTKVGGYDDLEAALKAQRAGDRVPVVVQRQGAETALELTLGEAPVARNE